MVLYSSLFQAKYCRYIDILRYNTTPSTTTSKIKLRSDFELMKDTQIPIPRPNGPAMYICHELFGEKGTRCIEAHCIAVPLEITVNPLQRDMCTTVSCLVVLIPQWHSSAFRHNVISHYLPKECSTKCYVMKLDAILNVQIIQNPKSILDCGWEFWYIGNWDILVCHMVMDRNYCLNAYVRFSLNDGCNIFPVKL